MSSLMRVGPRQYSLNKPLINKKENEEAKQPAANESNSSEGNLQKSKGLAYTQNSELPSASQSRPHTINYSTSPVSNSTQPPANPHKRSSRINIAQILKDFKNTALAIGTPQELVEEVDGYLDLIKKQIQKPEPSIKLVQSNLKNASGLLDKYISDTLNKDSKVVQNWVDAVFLQDVNYKYDEEEINQDFLVNVPPKKEEKPEEAQEPQTVQHVEDKDKDLKEKFVKAKKEASLEQFEHALVLSENAENKEIKPKITFEMGKIYDKQDNLPEALNYYQKTLETSSDKNLKCQTHYSMAKIYDDVNKFEPAVDHYFIAIGYAGETENLEAQSTFLTKLANMFADKYDKKAFDFYDEAEVIAEETDEPKTKGFVYSNTATALNKFNKPKDALKYYSDAIQNYSMTDSDKKIALNYKRAGELMSDYEQKDKAKSLLQKAMSYAMKTGDKDLMKEINKELSANM